MSLIPSSFGVGKPYRREQHLIELDRIFKGELKAYLGRETSFREKVNVLKGKFNHKVRSWRSREVSYNDFREGVQNQGQDQWMNQYWRSTWSIWNNRKCNDLKHLLLILVLYPDFQINRKDIKTECIHEIWEKNWNN